MGWSLARGQQSPKGIGMSDEVEPVQVGEQRDSVGYVAVVREEEGIVPGTALVRFSGEAVVRVTDSSQVLGCCVLGAERLFSTALVRKAHRASPDSRREEEAVLAFTEPLDGASGIWK